MFVDFCHTIKFALIHAAVTIGFAGNMIFDVFFILVILRELIDKGLVAAVCSQTLCTHEVHMLHVFF